MVIAHQSLRRTESYQTKVILYGMNPTCYMAGLEIGVFDLCFYSTILTSFLVHAWDGVPTFPV